MPDLDTLSKIIVNLGFPIVLLFLTFYFVAYKLLPLITDKMEQKDKIFTDTIRSITEGFRLETKEFRNSIEGLKEVITDLVIKIEKLLDRR